MTLAIYTSIKRLRGPSSPTSCKSRLDSPSSSSLPSPASPSTPRRPFLPASPPSDQIRNSPTKIGYIEVDDDDPDPVSKSNDSSLEGFCVVDKPALSDEGVVAAEESSSSSLQTHANFVAESPESNLSPSSPADPSGSSAASSSKRRPNTLSRSRRSRSHSESHSRSRSASRSRSRNRYDTVSSSSPSPSSLVSGSISSRRQSLPSSFSSSSSRPTSPRSASFGSAIRTCLDSKGHKVFARRPSDPEAPSPQFTRHRNGIFGIGEDSAEEEEEEPQVARRGRGEMRAFEASRANTAAARSTSAMFDQGDDLPMRATVGSRPSLPPLVIPPPGPPVHSPELSFPRSRPSASCRRSPQPIITFTPPPPLVPPSPSTFASFSQSSSKDLSGRRSGILRRAASSKGINRISRSTSVHVPKMQASPPRDEVSPQRQLEPESPSPPESIYPLTPPLSPALSSSDTASTGYSTEPLLSPATSVFPAEPIPASNSYSVKSPPRRSATVSFNLPLSPHEKARDAGMIGLGLTDLESRSPAILSKPPRPSAPPVSLNRYRNFHHRSYSEGYPSPNRFDLFEKAKSIPEEHPPSRVDQVQKLNLVLANPDPPRRPPKSPMRKPSHVVDSNLVLLQG